MGCTSIDTKRYQNFKVDYKQDFLNETKIDILFKKPFEELKQIESIRKVISISWNEVLKNSGAIVIKNPTIHNVFYGSLWKIANDCPSIKSIDSIIKFSLTEPYVQIVESDENQITNNVKELADSLRCFFSVAFTKNDEVVALSDSILLSYIDLNKQVKNPDKLFENTSTNLLNSTKNLERCKINLRKVERGKAVIEALRKIVEKTVTDVPELFKSLEDKNKIRQIIKVGENSRAKNLLNAPRIVWINEKHGERISKYEDYQKLIEDDNRNANKARIEENKSIEKQAYLEQPLFNQKPPGMIIEQPAGRTIIEQSLVNKIVQNIRGSSMKENIEVKNDSKIKLYSSSPYEDKKREIIQNQSSEKNNENKMKENRSPEKDKEFIQLKDKLENNEKLIKELQTKLIKYENNSQAMLPLPIYVVKYQILKSWQVLLKKSIHAKNNIPVKVIENLADLNLIVFGNIEGNVSIYEPDSYKYHEFSNDSHQGSVSALCYIFDGNTFFSGGIDGSVYKYEITSKNVSLFNKEDSPITQICYGFDGETIYIAFSNKLKAYDIRSKDVKLEEEKIIDSNNLDISSLHYVKSHNLLAVGYKNNSIDFYNTKNGTVEMVHTGSFPNDEIVDINSFVSNSTLCITYLEMNTKNLENSVSLLNYDKNFFSDFKRKEINMKNCKKICYCYDEKTLLIASSESNNGSFILYNLKNNAKRSLNKRGSALVSYSYLNGENLFAFSSEDGMIDFWGYSK